MPGCAQPVFEVLCPARVLFLMRTPRASRSHTCRHASQLVRGGNRFVTRGFTSDIAIAIARRDRAVRRGRRVPAAWGTYKITPLRTVYGFSALWSLEPQSKTHDFVTQAGCHPGFYFAARDHDRTCGYRMVSVDNLLKSPVSWVSLSVSAIYGNRSSRSRRPTAHGVFFAIW